MNPYRRHQRRIAVIIAVVFLSVAIVCGVLPALAGTALLGWW